MSTQRHHSFKSEKGIINLFARKREVDRLRDLIRKAQLSAGKVQRKPRRKRAHC